MWLAVRDAGNVHRLFAGVLNDCRLQDGVRTVTLANGMVVRELILDISDEHRRMAYAALGGAPRITAHLCRSSPPTADTAASCGLRISCPTSWRR